MRAAIQIVGRQAVVDIERRADLSVVRRGLAVPLATAIRRLAAEPESRSDLVSTPELASVAGRLHSQARRHATDDRCARLISAAVPEGSGLTLWHLWLAGATLTMVLFFVV